MEDLMTFVGIIIIVFGILQIVLFFKIWKMTNDVHKIKYELTSDKSINQSILLLLKGDTKLAYDKLYDSFLNDVITASRSSWTSNPAEDYKEDFNKIVELYKPIFEKIGLGHPDYSLCDELNKVKI